MEAVGGRSVTASTALPAAQLPAASCQPLPAFPPSAFRLYDLSYVDAQWGAYSPGPAADQRPGDVPGRPHLRGTDRHARRRHRPRPERDGAERPAGAGNAGAGRRRAGGRRHAERASARADDAADRGCGDRAGDDRRGRRRAHLPARRWRSCSSPRPAEVFPGVAGEHRALGVDRRRLLLRGAGPRAVHAGRAGDRSRRGCARSSRADVPIARTPMSVAEAMALFRQRGEDEHGAAAGAPREGDGRPARAPRAAGVLPGLHGALDRLPEVLRRCTPFRPGSCCSSRTRAGRPRSRPSCRTRSCSACSRRRATCWTGSACGAPAR